jgi:hypothetical protein
MSLASEEFYKKLLGELNVLLDINQSGYIILFNQISKHDYIKNDLQIKFLYLIITYIMFQPTSAQMCVL